MQFETKFRHRRLQFHFFSRQGDQKIWKKPKFSKSSPDSIQEKKKSHNIYNKGQFESPKYEHQITFETLKYLQQTVFWKCLFRWKCNKFALSKSSLKWLLHLFKKSKWPYKSSPMGEKSLNLVTLFVDNGWKLCVNVATWRNWKFSVSCWLEIWRKRSYIRVRIHKTACDNLTLEAYQKGEAQYS